MAPVVPGPTGNVVNADGSGRPVGPGPLPNSPVARLQPRTAGQLLDGGFEVLRFRFRTVATIAAPIVIPLIALPQMLALWFGGGIVPNSILSAEGNPLWFNGNDLGPTFWSTALVQQFSALGLMVAQMLVAVALTHLVGGWLVGSDLSASECLRFTLRRGPVAIAAFFIALLIKVVAAIPCALGLLYVIPALAVLAPVVAAEPGGPVAAVRRTMSLGRRRLGAILGISLLWWVVSLAVTAGAKLAAAVLGAYLKGSVTGAEIGLGAISVFTSIFLLVVQVCVTVLLYVDLRVRTEGLDLEVDLPAVLPATATVGPVAR